MSYVIAAAHSILPVLKPGNLVVLESTSPPRTTVDIIRPILEKTGLIAGRDFYLAYTPERVLPGSILNELVENARVIGGIDYASSKAGYDLFKVFVEGEIILTDATTAEMTKLMENTQRDVNIALANEFAHLADRFHVDIWEAIAIANKHPRVKILNPGPGVGGHCIGVDPWFLVEAAPEISSLIRTARQVNDSQPEYICQRVTQILGSLDGKTIAALGLAYKPDVDDLRESPAIAVVEMLQRSGAKVKAYEPFKPNAIIPGIQTTATLSETLASADLILILVSHSPFRVLDPDTIIQATGARLVFDSVNAWRDESWTMAGFLIHRLGNSKSKV